jgi:hypothetical protein
VPDCGRPASARGLCQSHDRQLKTTGETRAIRRYRTRRADTVKYAGLRLSPDCVEKLEALARERGISSGAAIAEILEGWNAARLKGRKTT